MEKKTLFPRALGAPFPLRNGLALAPRLVFIASLSLAAASQQAAAGTAIDLPPAGDLPVEFRCVEDVGSGSDICPIELIEDEEDFYILDLGDDTYLNFTALEDLECGYAPDVSNTTEGAGVWSNCTEDGSSISSFDSEVLEIDVMEDLEAGGESSSLPIEGIYLFPLSSTTGEGAVCGEEGSPCCLPDDQGTVEVTFEDFTTGSFDYSSDTSTEGGGGGFCEDFEGGHAVFVDFGSTQEVRSIRVVPEPVLDPFGSGSGLDMVSSSVYAAGLELVTVPDVSPENCEGEGEDNNDCKIQVGDPELDGGDLKVVISDPTLVGDVDVVGGPWRVRDDRPHCQWDASPGDTPFPLVFDDVTTFNVNDVNMFLPLVVSDNDGPVQYFTIQDTSCGIPRMNYGGPNYEGAPVPRGFPGSVPYLDIVELDSNIVPLASVLGFESDGLDGTDYACQPPGYAYLETQPVMEINVREFEAKILSGTPGTINEVARDITVDCGSKRGSFRGYSFVAWNMVHAIQTDMRAEIGAEVDALLESTQRYASCVDSSFYYGQLYTLPARINTYYDLGVRFMDLTGNGFFAGRFFDIAVASIEQLKSNLEATGVSNNLLRCYASSVDPGESPRLDLIKDTLTPLGSDVPLNAWGDLISQLEHLSYAIRTYRDELIDSPGAPPT